MCARLSALLIIANLSRVAFPVSRGRSILLVAEQLWTTPNPHQERTPGTAMRSFTSVARWAKQIEHTAQAIPAGVASLRVRILLLVVLALGPAFGMLLYTTMERRGYEAAQAQADALSLVRLASAQQERLIEGARELLTGLAQLPVVRRGDTIGCDDLLFDLC